MTVSFATIAAIAAANHSVVTLDDLIDLGVGSQTRAHWVKTGRLVRLGPRSFAIGGSAPTWRRTLAAGVADLRGHGFIAGRAGAQMWGLDDFAGCAAEYLVPRARRQLTTTGVVASTSLPIERCDVTELDGLAVLRPEGMILDTPLFGFSRHEIENAIDSAIRLRLVSEQRMRTRVVARHRQAINGGRALLDALVDTGGESRLERMFLRLCRGAGLPRPTPQRVFRADGRTVARVDFVFPCGLIVEVLGFGSHSSRRQMQRDEQRRTELVIMGRRSIGFTYDDVRYRPAWVAAQVTNARRAAA